MILINEFPKLHRFLIRSAFMAQPLSESSSLTLEPALRVGVYILVIRENHPPPPEIFLIPLFFPDFLDSHQGLYFKEKLNYRYHLFLPLFLSFFDYLFFLLFFSSSIPLSKFFPIFKMLSKVSPQGQGLEGQWLSNKY